MHFSRAIDSNPFHYESFGLKKLSLNLSGNVYTLDHMDFPNGLVTPAFNQLIQACGVGNDSFTFDLMDYQGCYR